MYRTALFAVLLFADLTKANGQWTIQNSHTAAGLRGIHSVGGSIAWASGTDGTVLKTADGGALWQNCSTPIGAENLDFRGIQGFDQNTAIAMSSGKGDLSRVYKTTDGCRSWKLVFTNPAKDGFWDAIRFRFDPPLNPAPEYSEGVILGDPVNGNFVIFTTRDGGDTWRPSTDSHGVGAKAMKGESLFSASNSVALVPGVNGPFTFVTGGRSGSRLLSLEPHNPFDRGINYRFSITKIRFPTGEFSGAFSVASRSHGKFGTPDLMVVGGDSRAPDAAGSTAYFSPRGVFPTRGDSTSNPPHGYRSAVAYDLEHKLWITVGPNGTDISTDDGTNWRAVKPLKEERPDADQNWNALSLPFAVGPQGRIGKLNAKALTQ